MTLDLNDLAVQSFATVDGDPSQWLMRVPPPTDDSSPECCDLVARWGKPVTVDTGDRCCG